MYAIEIHEMDAEEFFGPNWNESPFVKRDDEGRLLRGLEGTDHQIRFYFKRLLALEGPGQLIEIEIE